MKQLLTVGLEGVQNVPKVASEFLLWKPIMSFLQDGNGKATDSFILIANPYKEIPDTRDLIYCKY